MWTQWEGGKQWSLETNQKVSLPIWGKPINGRVTVNLPIHLATCPICPICLTIPQVYTESTTTRPWTRQGGYNGEKVCGPHIVCSLRRKEKHNLSNDMDEYKTAAVNSTLKRGTTCYGSYDSSLKGEVGVDRRESRSGRWSGKASLKT